MAKKEDNMLMYLGIAAAVYFLFLRPQPAATVNHVGVATVPLPPGTIYRLPAPLPVSAMQPGPAQEQTPMN